MSTNDPGSRNAAATPPQDAGLNNQAERVYVPGGTVPDAAVLARLASDFFAALPGALAVTDVTGMPQLPGNLPLQAGASPDLPNLFSAPGSALPADLLEALRVPPQDPMTASVASPTGPSFYFVELARTAPAEQTGTSTSAPSMPPVTEYAPAPGSDLPSVPNNPVGATGLPSQIATAQPGASPVGSSFYFLQSETSPSPNPVPTSLPVTDDYSFPKLPGFEEVPNVSDFSTASNLENEDVRDAQERPTGHGGDPDLTRATTEPAIDAAQPAVTANAPATPGVPQVTYELPLESGAKAAEAGPSDSSFYFLQGKIPAAIQAVPAKLPVTEQFSFPGVPGFQSFPASSGVPATELTEEDLRALPSSLAGTSQIPAKMPEAGSGPFEVLNSDQWGGFRGISPSRHDKVPDAAPHANDKLFELAPGMLPALGLAPGLFDPHAIRQDFPTLQERVHGRPLVWLDNGATTHKPNAVIDRLSSYYRHENSNVHRAAHTLAARSTDAYEGAREKVRKFLNASSTREIVFVRGTTEAINLVAKSWGWRNVDKDDEVVITWLEHHANIVPWQQLCDAKGAKLRVAPVNDRGEVRLDEYEKLLNPRTRIVAFSHVSNALGSITPAREMTRMAHRHGARVLIDGAQSVAHMREDVQELDCDFFVFSGHKVFAPFGVGVVYAKGDLFDTTPPWQGGGNMIADVTFEKTTYSPAPNRFEAGTGTIADAVGLGAALDYLMQVGIENVTRYEHDLLAYATTGLLTVPGIHIVGNAQEKAGVLSFVLDGLRTEDVGKALDEEGIAVRAGHHCAQPILRRFGHETTVRATLAMYNTCEDVDALVSALHRIRAGSGSRGIER